MGAGLSQRLTMYARRNRLLRAGLGKLGMVPLTCTGRESHSVVTASVPAGIEFQDLYDGLKSLGYIVYGCKDVLAERFFQVANMGDIDDDQVRLFLLAVEDVLGTLRKKNPKRAALLSLTS